MSSGMFSCKQEFLIEHLYSAFISLTSPCSKVFRPLYKSIVFLLSALLFKLLRRLTNRKDKKGLGTAWSTVGIAANLPQEGDITRMP